jgi:CheY-like chemotaxis protein
MLEEERRAPELPDIVLIVEDEPDVRENLALLLELKGYRVITAGDGKQALDCIAEHGPPCLILLDLMMPVMDGWQVRAALLEDPILAEIPVVVVSGVVDADDAVRDLEAVAHLRKPIDLGKLYRVVSSYC